MLVELRIQDYAVLDDLSLELGPGLTALTGETGAGKSIIVGALSLLVGERASSEVVRTGAERAVVEAVFDVQGRPAIAARAKALDLDLDDGHLILKREVQAEGRNRAWVNGSPSTAKIVGELGAELVDIHGQHEHQSLLRRTEQRDMLDGFAGGTELAAAVRGRYDEVIRIRSQLSERQARLEELKEEAEFLRFQLQEIEAARIDPEEEAELEAELRRLEHVQELTDGASRLHDALYQDEGSVTDRLAEAREALVRLAGFDDTLADAHRPLEEAFHQIAEVGRQLGDYAAGMEPDPGRLEEIRARQDVLFRLKRKYGPELSDVLATRDSVKKKVEELEGSTLDIEGLESKLERARDALRAAAGELSAARRAGADRMAEAMMTVLPSLGMEEARFEVGLDPLDEPGPGGAEHVEFRVSVNEGFEPAGLARIASGGELSRIMLALKSILAEVDQVPTLVFDEIDAGVGGVVATAVAAKLREVSMVHQVFVVTHLPQVAAKARAHLRVDKDAEEGVAATQIESLEGDERVQEVARMLGGDPESEKSREHARELLDLA